MITLALSKGRIFDETLPFLQKAGIEVFFEKNSRKLVIPTNQEGVQIILLRASDVPTYVEHGAADIGVAGYDVLLEHDLDQLFCLINLQIAACRLSVAAKHDFDYEKNIQQGSRLQVATKYPEQAREHFSQKGVHVDIIKLYGSMELAPLVGLADVIVDVVSSGNTLRENHLKEVEVIHPIASYLIANKASYHTKFHKLSPILEAFANHIDKNN
jgi:ATP phosphoribosyltransferase